MIGTPRRRGELPPEAEAFRVVTGVVEHLLRQGSSGFGDSGIDLLGRPLEQARDVCALAFEERHQLVCLHDAIRKQDFDEDGGHLERCAANDDAERARVDFCGRWGDDHECLLV